MAASSALRLLRRRHPSTTERCPLGTHRARSSRTHLERKYHISPQQLADHLGLSTLKAAALRRHLGIADDDDRYCHVFDFGSQKPRRYSDNALREMKQALDAGLDIDEVWRQHGRRRRPARAGR